ncbi:MAG TPA: hypothetical protein VJ385_00030 [Fibrobacteria bacterium]|nr:hypothetical protein [Fibrobacteria bacterium]
MTSGNAGPLKNEGRNGRISFLRLEKYLLNELSPGQRMGLEAEAKTDDELSGYIRDMRKIKTPFNWLRLYSRLMGPQPASGRSNPRPLFTSLSEWVSCLLPKPSRSVLAWGGSLAVVLLVVPVLFLSSRTAFELRSKGASRPDIALEVSGARIAAWGKCHVKPGDILTFSYRSAKPLFTQIWYMEDSGTPSLFEGRADASLNWEPTSGWRTAPQRIRLEGNWKLQRVVILASRKAISEGAASRIVSGDMKSTGDVDVFSYDLIQP